MPVRRRLRAVIRRHPMRVAALGAATLVAGALTFTLLQAHGPQADEIAAAVPQEVTVSEAVSTAEQVPREEASAPAVPPDEPGDIEDRLQAAGASAAQEDRWSTAMPAPAADASSTPPLMPAGQNRAAMTGNVFAPLIGEDGAAQPDSTTTAAISPDASDASTQVDVADSEADVAALEQAFASRHAHGFAPVEAEGSTTGLMESGDRAAPTGTGTVDRHVNLRAEADNDATILAVVPQNGEVAILDDCPNWCAVEYQGHQGYIFGTFIEREQTAAGSL